MAPIAAKHGAQSRLNARNENPAMGVSMAPMIGHISSPDSATSEKPNRTPKVPTTFSLASSPVMVPTENCHSSPHPRGTNIHVMALPMSASIESLMSPTIDMLQSKAERNHMMPQARSMNVPAFLTNAHPFSKVDLMTVATPGM